MKIVLFFVLRLAQKFQYQLKKTQKVSLRDIQTGIFERFLCDYTRALFLLAYAIIIKTKKIKVITTVKKNTVINRTIKNKMINKIKGIKKK